LEQQQFYYKLYSFICWSSESVYIFSTLDIEPFERINSGIYKLLSAILLLWLGKALLANLLSAGIMSG